jgi:soluble lytic murein transglycosylase-like protein
MKGRSDRQGRNVLFFAAMISLLLPFFTTAAAGDIYRYIDSQGVMHFTNVPTASSKQYHHYVRAWPETSTRWRAPAHFDPMIHQAARHHGISPGLLKALIKVESDFDPKAVSRSGALGLMQIMPDNLEALDISDPFDPWENIMGGTRYLTELIKRFGGQLPLALAAYNAGPNLVERYNRIPPIRETEDFVNRVMKYYYAFRE